MIEESTEKKALIATIIIGAVGFIGMLVFGYQGSKGK
jgi:preprotein translocase subunit Sss1